MSPARISSAVVLAGIASLSLGAVALALVTQHAFDMQPCPWCVLQRLEFVVIGALALLALAWRAEHGLRAAEEVAALAREVLKHAGKKS